VTREVAVLLWGDKQLAVLDRSLDQARAGHPTTLTVVGDAGLGKTSLLDELVARAAGFRVLTADGFENARSPFHVLAQWGVDPPSALDDGVGTPFVAAQGLRQLIDRVGDNQPVLLRIDDVHWADPESIEALTWLLRRASGDRLLVAAGSRPLAPDGHVGWQRWTAAPDHGATIALTGLSSDQTAELVNARRPGIAPDIVERLREHTDGNPLYLTALLTEFDVAELTQMRVLPAPAEFAALLGARVSRLPPETVTVLRAVSVLGTGWASLPDAAAVADSANAAAAVAELVEADLVRMRDSTGAVDVRAAHALVRAAVYQQTPLVERRRLHARAATVVVEPSAQFEHRMAAAEQYDDELADSMGSYAAQLYQQHSFRLAAQYLRWSSILTPDPKRREQRRLESLFYSVMALDVDLVHAEQAQIARAGDEPMRALVLGGLAIWERRFHDGIAMLETVEPGLSDAVDASTRYRIEVLLAWARMCVGHDPAQIMAAIDRAAAVRVADAGLDGSELVTGGGTAVRVSGFRSVLEGDYVAAVPARAVDTPLHLTKQLIWRGAVRARLGHFDEGIEDLAEGTRRIQNGVTDFGRGAFHASFAFAHWMRGHWGRARLNARLALDFSGRFSHPMVLAMSALPDIGDGRFDEADELLDRATAILDRAPWWEACQLLTISRIARVHAGGSADERARLLPSLRGTPFDFPDLTNTSPMLRLHLGLAAVWADETGLAQQCADSLATQELGGPWVAAGALWLRGLVAVSRGQAESAAMQLASAVALEVVRVPLYRAHLLVDQARLSRHLQREQTAKAALDEAAAIYTRLGASPYLDQLAMSAGADRPSDRTSTVRFALTDREQDVLTLVAAGMSYAQVSRELFVTQSTVSYHLSNLYDKTGIRGRHQLSELFRREPEAFGLAPSA
jgi:DNA-binding CsgD family transcriptional regulator